MTQAAGLLNKLWGPAPEEPLTRTPVHRFLDDSLAY